MVTGSGIEAYFNLLVILRDLIFHRYLILPQQWAHLEWLYNFEFLGGRKHILTPINHPMP
jgi:hypothetical protein